MGWSVEWPPIYLYRWPSYWGKKPNKKTIERKAQKHRIDVETKNKRPLYFNDTASGVGGKGCYEFQKNPKTFITQIYIKKIEIGIENIEAETVAATDLSAGTGSTFELFVLFLANYHKNYDFVFYSSLEPMISQKIIHKNPDTARPLNTHSLAPALALLR